MNLASKNTSFWFNAIGLVLIGGLTLGVTAPLEGPFFRFFTVNAVTILFSILAIAAIAYCLRQNFILLVSSIASIVICIFLKDPAHSTFNYAQTADDTQLTIAHLLLDNDSSLANIERNLSSVDADLISIQIPVQFVAQQPLLANTQKDFPFCKQTICGDSLAIVLLSRTAIYNVDTLCYANTISVAATIKKVGLPKEVSFISTHVPAYHQLEKTREQLTQLSSYIKKYYSNHPFLTLSGSQLASWMPEIKNFKTVNALNDSRIDVAYEPNKHIFYSADLVCTSFQHILDGQGVLATYQFKGTKPAAQISSIDL